MTIKIEKYEAGDKVIFTECTQEQINWGANDDPNEILTKDKIYVVSDVDIHSSHTKLTLDGIKGRFNSVCFNKS